MYLETKELLKKSFKISKILFFMGPLRYNKLLELTSRIKPPFRNEVMSYVEEGLLLEEAIRLLLIEKYKEVAVNNGFTENQGIAMLEYALLLEEIKKE